MLLGNKKQKLEIDPNYYGLEYILPQIVKKQTNLSEIISEALTDGGSV